MPFGKGKTKEPKAPKEKKPKKEKAPKEKKQKKEKAPKEPGQKKKLNPIMLIIPLAVIAAAAAIIFFVVLPRFRGSEEPPEPTPTLEPQPPVLPTSIPVGDTPIIGMELGADESGATAEQAKTITYIYSNLNDAGRAAETYARQLAGESPTFYVVNEEFVRSDLPDFSAPEGMVLMARNVPQEEPAATAPPESDAPEDGESQPPESPEPEPEPTEEPVKMVLTVRITWSEGQCIVTADEVEGEVTSPPRDPNVPSGEVVTILGAQDRLKSMSPAELGLPGESMDEYEVMPRNGMEMVDGVACIRLYVYEDSSRGGSEFMGSYLMSVDGRHLYRVDPITDEIEVLK